MKKNKHIGSDFDDFLQEEGILEEVEIGAIKKIIAYEIQHVMIKHQLTQSQMAEKLKTSRSAIRRLLDPKNASVTLITLNKFAHAFGKKLEIRFD